MNLPFIDKLAHLEHALSQDKGDFELFGAFLREESFERWDLIVAAPWLDPDQLESFNTIGDALKKTLTRQESLAISRIVVLEKGNPFLEGVLALVSVEHGQESLANVTISGVTISRAFIITACRRIARKRRRNRDSSAAK